MRFITVLCLLVVAFVYLTVAQVSFDDCCLKYTRKNRTIQKHAVSYKQQLTDGGCNLPAIIFTLRKGRVYCTNPKEQWVTDLMKTIDAKKGKVKSKLRKRPSRG